MKLKALQCQHQHQHQHNSRSYSRSTGGGGYDGDRLVRFGYLQSNFKPKAWELNKHIKITFICIGLCVCCVLCICIYGWTCVHSYKMIRLLYDCNIVFLLVCCSPKFHPHSRLISNLFERHNNWTTGRVNESRKKIGFIVNFTVEHSRCPNTWYIPVYMSSNDLEIKFANQAPNRNINFPTDGRCVSAQANRVRESKVKRRTSLPKRPYNITSANGCSAENFLFAMFSAVFGWCCLWPIDCVWIVFPFGEGDSALAHTFGSLKFRHQ